MELSPRQTSARRRRARLLVALALGTAFLVGPPAPQAARARIDYLDKPIPEWREGPVRYIITRWEDEEYKSLDNQEDRARFIETFWRRRDETPDTPGNEFRAEFWKRVRNANNLYAEETSRDGWRTDRGKIYVLRGPPDDVSRDPMSEGRRGTEVWTYRNSGDVGLGPNVVVAFAQDTTGEYRLSTEPSKDSDPKQGMPMAYQPAMGTTALVKSQALIAQANAAAAFNLTDPLIRQAGGPSSETTLGLITQLTKLQQPPKEWEIRETVTTQEFYGAVPLRARADFFRTSGPETLVVLTAGVRSSSVHYRRVGGRDIADVSVYARIMDLTGNDLVRALAKDDDFVPAEENLTAGLDDDLVFQAHAPIAPGSYKVLLSVIDQAGGRAGSYEIPITVPDFTQAGLTVSSLLLARSISGPKAPSGERAAAMAPFAMGNLHVLPRLTQTFSPGEDLAFYYQVYGAATQPESGTPRLNVDYGFYTVASEQSQDLGHVAFADQDKEAHGYSLKLAGWPPGAYLLRVSVTDEVARATASREMVFRVR